MRRSAVLLATLFFLGSHAPSWAQNKTPEAAKKIPDGVYAMPRYSLKEMDLRVAMSRSPTVPQGPRTTCLNNCQPIKRANDRQ